MKEVKLHTFFVSALQLLVLTTLTPVPIGQEAVWVPGPMWTQCKENKP